ncbi:MAG: hypothetical protein ACOCVK_01955 [bacterium]
MIRRFVFLLLVAVSAITTAQVPRPTGLRVSAPQSSTDSLSQYGITWEFDRNVQYGTFFNGDYWVVGPVEVIGITPEPSGGRNGSMINPGVFLDDEGRRVMQAYDERVGWYASQAVARPPFTLEPGDSLVSTVSMDESADTDGDGYVDDLLGNRARVSKSNLRTAAVLTVLDSPPAELSFRPPYGGTDKPIIPISSVQWDRLPDLAPVPGSRPSIAELERLYQRPWLQHISSSAGEVMHPIMNMPQYHGVIMSYYRDSLLTVLLDEDKESLVLLMIQNGIDAGYVIQHGRCSISMGKGNILLAGLLLDHDDLLNVFIDGRNQHDFKEDYMTYFIGDRESEIESDIYQNAAGESFPADYSIGDSFTPPRADMGLWRQRPGHLEHEHLHPSEWHRLADGGDPGGIKRESYRNVNSPDWVGVSFAMRYLGLEEEWAHPAYFAYMERWLHQDFSPFIDVVREDSSADYHDYDSYQGNYGSEFTRQMYDAYGNDL